MGDISGMSLARIHAEHHGRILGYLRRMVGPAEAEDLCQTVFLKAGYGLAAFEGKSAVSTWLFRIAANTAMDALRSRKGRAAESNLTETPQGFGLETCPSAEREAIRQEMSDCIRGLVDTLSPGARTVLHLADVEGFTAAEIAEVLEVSLAAAKIRLHRARGGLRELMENHCRFYRNEDNILSCDRIQSDS